MLNDILREAGITPPVAAVEVNATNPTVNGLTDTLTFFADDSEEARFCDYDLYSPITPGIAFSPALMLGRN